MRYERPLDLDRCWRQAQARNMADHTKYEFEIYHNDVLFKAPGRGKKNYLKEKAFLNELTGLPRGYPGPENDFYMLSDEQVDAYSAFRKDLRRR